MNELLIHSSRELSEDDAGLHGNRWGVFKDDVSALFSQWLMRTDEDFVLPIYYVAERLFESDWHPEVGKYVAGTLWMQAYATARLERK